MDKTEIIIAGILFFSLAITAFLLTLIEFVNMDKNPDKYKNPRYKKSLKGALTMGNQSPKSITKRSLAEKKSVPAKKTVAQSAPAKKGAVKKTTVAAKKLVTAKKGSTIKTLAAKKSVTKKTVTAKRSVGRSAKRK